MDYGFRKKRRMTGQMKLTIAGSLVLCLAIVGYFATASFLRDRDKNIADARQYGAQGTPCASTTKADLEANGPGLRHGFDFGDMHMNHAFGDADCAYIAGDGGAGMSKFPVCRFTSPGSIEVAVGQTDVFFRPPLGKPAAIVLDKGDKVRCLLTAKEMG